MKNPSRNVALGRVWPEDASKHCGILGIKVVTVTILASTVASLYNSGIQPFDQGSSMTMKYFTPERWLRFQEPRDKQVFYAASEEWEQALKAYRRKLRQLLRASPRLREPLLLWHRSEKVEYHQPGQKVGVTGG
jgi:hypothetical protein